jgi:hypothetical protein
VQARTGEQRHEHGVACGEAAIVEEATQGDALVDRVAKTSSNGGLVEHAGRLGVAPLEEPVSGKPGAIQLGCHAFFGEQMAVPTPIFAALLRVALLLAGGICLAAMATAAEGAVARALARSLTGKAKTSYESAKLLFDDGDHAGVLTRFKRAYDVSKDVAVLWNIGVCEKELNHCAGSARVVSRYLKEGGQR